MRRGESRLQGAAVKDEEGFRGQMIYRVRYLL